MEHKGIRYRFTAAPWQYAGKGGWHFASLPADMSKEIRANLQSSEEGWGRLKAVAKVGNTAWKTAIWFSGKTKTYLLPLKADIRKQEKIVTGKQITVEIWV